MDDMTSFERQLAVAFKGLMGLSEPVDDAAIYNAISTPRSPKWRVQPMFDATRFIIAAAIVTSFAGVLLSGVLTQPSDDPLPAVASTATPEATMFPPIQLPPDIPADVRSGTLETPFGPARWVHLTGDETSLPSQFSDLLSTQSGYVVPDFDSQTGTSEGLWRSPDLIRWTLEEPLGIGAGIIQMWRAGDTYWLSSGGGRDGDVLLWRSRDTETWEQVALEELDPPGPAGYAWVVQPGQPVTYEEVTIVPLTWTADFWVVLRELPGIHDLERPALVKAAPGVFAVKEIESFPRGALSADTYATLRMEETELGLRVTDDADGTELAVLEGVSLDFVERLAVEEGTPIGGYVVDPVPGLAILDGEGLVALDLPLEAEGLSSHALTADQGGFVSVTIGRDGLVHVHHTQDGREWSETDIIGDDMREPTGFDGVWTWLGPVSSGSVVLSTATGAWQVVNGRLERAPAPPGGDGFRIASGWVVGPGSRGEPRISFLPDQGERASIDLSDMGIRFGDCGSGEGLISSNTLVTTLDEGCAGRREAWIVTFDDLPASGATTE